MALPRLGVKDIAKRRAIVCHASYRLIVPGTIISKAYAQMWLTNRTDRSHARVDFQSDWSSPQRRDPQASSAYT
jgi:hypothetical protein